MRRSMACMLVVIGLVLIAADDRVEYGKASWYGKQYHGRRVSECWQTLRDNPAVKDCERFDMNAMTAAHKTLPFGTMVTCCRVDRPEVCVVVRINDRGPFVRGRIIDLSKKAATDLDMLHEGVVKVRITW